MPRGSAVSARCGWCSSEAFLGTAASSGLSVLALEEMLPISHVSSGITSPNQGPPRLLVAIVLYHPKRQHLPHREAAVPRTPALLELLLSQLSAQWPCSWVLASQTPLFLVLVTQNISRWQLKEGPSLEEAFFFFYHEGKTLITTHSNHSQVRNKCSESTCPSDMKLSLTRIPRPTSL